jgi:hypothetical protein
MPALVRCAIRGNWQGDPSAIGSTLEPFLRLHILRQAQRRLDTWKDAAQPRKRMVRETCVIARELRKIARGRLADQRIVRVRPPAGRLLLILVEFDLTRVNQLG